DRLWSSAAAFLLQHGIAVEQVRIGLSELSQPALSRIAGGSRDTIPPRLDDVEGTVGADPLRLVPERVHIGCARGVGRERGKRKCRNNICGDQAASYDTTHREQGGLGMIIRQRH